MKIIGDLRSDFTPYSTYILSVNILREISKNGMQDVVDELSLVKGIVILEMEGKLIKGRWKLTNFYSTQNLQKVKSNLEGEIWRQDVLHKGEIKEVLNKI